MRARLGFKQLIVSGAIVLALLMVLFPFSGYPASFSHSAAVVLVTLVGWSTGIFPPYLTALIFFALTVVFQLVPANVVFSGFSSTAVWLIISGFVIGSAISVSGLGKRLASFIAPHLTSSYPRMIGGLVASAVLLGFVMPSSIGRAVVLVPIGMALAERVGFARGSNGRLGIATSLAIACNMPSFAVLPANIPNMILAGASDTLFDIEFGYMEYLLLHFPVLGLLKSAILVWVVLRVFPDEIRPQQVAEAGEQSETGDPAMQKKVAVLLGITLLLWITDSWHGVSPAWVGLAAAIVLLLPKWGVVAAKNFNSSVDFATIVFVAAALGLGALVNESGIGAAMGQAFTHMLPADPDQSFLSFMALSVIAAVTGLVATIPGVPTVLTPMAADFAAATGMTVPAVLMTQVVGFSTVIFPYQVGPLLVAMQMSNEPLYKLLKITLPLAVITLLILFPLDYLWWMLLGWL